MEQSQLELLQLRRNNLDLKVRLAFTERAVLLLRSQVAGGEAIHVEPGTEARKSGDNIAAVEVATQTEPYRAEEESAVLGGSGTRPQLVLSRPALKKQSRGRSMTPRSCAAKEKTMVRFASVEGRGADVGGDLTQEELVDMNSKLQEQLKEYALRVATLQAVDLRRAELQSAGQLLATKTIQSGAPEECHPIEELFTRYAGQATSLELREPYLVSPWQVRNLEIFFDALKKKTSVTKVWLHTHVRSREAESPLEHLRNRVALEQITVDITFAPELHLRELLFSNGITISADRGLDLYQAPDRFGVRRCRGCKILYFEANQAEPATAHPGTSHLLTDGTDNLFTNDPWAAFRQSEVSAKRSRPLNSAGVIVKPCRIGYVDHICADKGFGFVSSAGTAEHEFVVSRLFLPLSAAASNIRTGDLVAFESRQDRINTVAILDSQALRTIQRWWRRKRLKHHLHKPVLRQGYIDILYERTGIIQCRGEPEKVPFNFNCCCGFDPEFEDVYTIEVTFIQISGQDGRPRAVNIKVLEQPVSPSPTSGVESCVIGRSLQRPFGKPPCLQGEVEGYSPLQPQPGADCTSQLQPSSVQACARCGGYQCHAQDPLSCGVCGCRACPGCLDPSDFSSAQAEELDAALDWPGAPLSGWRFSRKEAAITLASCRMLAESEYWLQEGGQTRAVLASTSTAMIEAMGWSELETQQWIEADEEAMVEQARHAAHQEYLSWQDEQEALTGY